MKIRKSDSLNTLIYFPVMFFIVFTISLHSLAQKKDSSESKISKKLSSVEIQWEDNKEAVKYQVQVFNSKKKFLRTFESKTSLLKFKSTSGQVKIRGRYLNGYGKYSEWSSLIDIEVPPEPVNFNDKPDNKSGNTTSLEAQASNKTMKGKVILNWKPAAQAKKYKVKIYDKQKNLLHEFLSSSTTHSIELEAGEYDFSITSIGNDEIPGKEAYSPQSIKIKSAQLSTLPFKLEVLDPIKKTFKVLIPKKDSIIILGKLEFSYHLVENWKTIEELSNISDTWSPSADLKPGKYKISFWGTKPGWQDSGAFTHEFIIKPKESDLKEITN